MTVIGENPSFYRGSKAASAGTAASPSTPVERARQIALKAGGSLAKGSGSGQSSFDPKIKSIVKTYSGKDDNIKALQQNLTALQKYKWNLPPHTSSLPIEPHKLDNYINDTKKSDIASKDPARRGRIYYYSRVDNDYVGKPLTGDALYGFQFLWNPTSISTSVAVNLDVTPTSSDKFVGVVGAFPSGEALSLSLKVNRVNDMFAINTAGKTDAGLLALKRSYAPSMEKALSDRDFLARIKDLKDRGTIADIEYLYKAINGSGWTNAATGKDTSDIGFLTPTLLRIDVGPLSYLGYVSSLAITHNLFTKAMVPMDSDVSINFNLMATAGKSSKGTVVSN